jgi:hypothetical protein
MTMPEENASPAASYERDLRAALDALESSQLRFDWPARDDWMHVAWAVAGYRTVGMAVPPELRARLRALGYAC